MKCSSSSDTARALQLNNGRYGYTPTRNANNRDFNQIRYSIEIESGMNLRKSRIDSMNK